MVTTENNWADKLLQHHRDIMSDRYNWVEDEWRPKKLSRAQRRGKHLSKNYRKKNKIRCWRKMVRLSTEFILGRLNEPSFMRRILPATPVMSSEDIIAAAKSIDEPGQQILKGMEELDDQDLDG